MNRQFAALVTFLVVTFGFAAAAGAEEYFPAVLAQVPNMSRGPGLYLNLFKFVPVVLIYILWAWTTNWVEHDTQELNNLKFAIWNSAVFFSGVLGLVLALAIPIYFLGLGLLLLAYFIPLFTYIYAATRPCPTTRKC